VATRQKSGNKQGMLGDLRNSPEIKRLTDEARNLFDAQTGRLAGRVGDGVTGAAEKLTQVGQTGQLPAIGEGAKRLLSGDGPIRSAVGAATSGVTSKAKDLVQGGKGKGSGQSRAVNIEESLDIGVPVSVAYDQWTQFKDFSRFTKGVESVEQDNDAETTWRAKVFKSTRTWKAKIVEQVPDRRIVWTSEGSKGSTKGVVTFHPLADDLTRVLVALEYHPGGFVEKTGNIWRAAGRRTRLDLKNFRRFVMMENEPTGSWRGEIREGKVVKGPDEGGGRKRGSGRSRTDDRPRKSSGSNARPKKSTSRSAPRKSSGSNARPKKSTSRSATRSSSDSDARPKKSTSRSATRSSADSNGRAKKSTSRSATRSSSDSNGRAKKSTSQSATRSSSDSNGRAKKSTSQSSARKSTSTSRPKKSTAQSRTAKSAPRRPSKSSSQRSSGAKKSTASSSRGAGRAPRGKAGTR
jgi:uncharacterized membrane protein